MSYWQRDCTAVYVQFLLFKNLQLPSPLLLPSTACILNCSPLWTENQLCNIFLELTFFWPSLGSGKFHGLCKKSSRETSDGKWPDVPLSFFDEAFSSLSTCCHLTSCLAKNIHNWQQQLNLPITLFMVHFMSWIALSNFTICWSAPYVKPPLLCKKIPKWRQQIVAELATIQFRIRCLLIKLLIRTNL